MSPVTIRDQTGRQFTLKPGQPLERAMLQCCRAYGEETAQIVFSALFRARSVYDNLTLMRRRFGDYMEMNTETLHAIDPEHFMTARMQELLTRVEDTVSRI